MNHADLTNARPLPEAVVIASRHGVPLVNTGFHSWGILDLATNKQVCQISFHAADHTHPEYGAYMEARKTEATELAKIINLGLQLHYRGA